jgi:predicted flavoprotein YhiN
LPIVTQDMTLDENPVADSQLSLGASLFGTTHDSRDLVIVGAGAAGLAAAIFAADAARAAGPPARIALLDGAKRLGAKILVSGGGRCNVTHDEVRAEDFNGDRRAIRSVLAAFDADATVRWFASLGVRLKREPTGKLFPTSDRARDVLDALLYRCETVGVELLADHRVHDICPLPTPSESEVRPSKRRGGCASPSGSLERAGAEQVRLRRMRANPEPQTGSQADDARTQPERYESPPSSFLVHHDHGELHARRVIIATGGRSLPRSGSDGSGWEILRNLGHTVTPAYPALVPLVLDERMFHAEISGLSHDAELTTLVAGRPVDRRSGSLLWTHFGVSGPVVMDASRHWVIAHAEGRQVELRCNFLPGRRFEEVEREVIEAATAHPRTSVAKFVAEQIPARLAALLVQRAGVEPALPLAQLSREGRRRLCHALTELPLPVTRDRGWNHAEVTAGGVPLAEVDSHTMQSRRVPGLHLCGELLDVDGRIGGFNFQWAWATGYLAGRAAARD